MQNLWLRLKQQLTHIFRVQIRFLPIYARWWRFLFFLLNLFNICNEEFGIIAKTGHFITGMPVSISRTRTNCPGQNK